jgi:SAM-dependent methyltransferase
LLPLQAKFTQINEFLKLLIHTGQLEHMGQQQQQHGVSSSSSAVHVLDCGCGSSHLTFGTLHYLHNVRGLPLQLTGIDTNAALMQRSNRYCADLGISDMAEFHTAAIRSYSPETAPDIVLALHACDTATDEALALGVRLQTDVIMSVPCCQKDLHKQQAAAQQQQRQVQRRPGSSSWRSDSEASSSSSSGELFDPLLSHGILRQRMLDLLTDGFRAQLLQLAGYRYVQLLCYVMAWHVMACYVLIEASYLSGGKSLRAWLGETRLLLVEDPPCPGALLHFTLLCVTLKFACFSPARRLV